jgi:hypothetical protein
MTIRGNILETARGLTEGDRNKSYGDPLTNLQCFAGMVDYYARALPGRPLDAVDGAVLMILAKVSRIAVNKGHKDNYVDLCAYGAIAGECAERLLKHQAPSLATWAEHVENLSRE